MQATAVRTIHTAQLNSGAHIAYSTKSPYFCFEAETEAQALATAARAIDYVRSVEGRY